MFDFSYRLIDFLCLVKEKVPDTVESAKVKLLVQKPLSMILVDSLVVGVIALLALMPTGIPNLQQWYTMARAFLGAFILELAVERGLKGRKSDK